MEKSFKDILGSLSDKELSMVIATISSGYVAQGNTTPSQIISFMEDLYHRIKTSDEELDEECDAEIRSIIS